MTDDRDWTDAEREALREAAGEAAPPPGLEDRIVEAATEGGLVDRPGATARPLRSRWGPAIAVAAAIAIFALGAWTGSRLAGPDDPEGPRFVLLLYEGPGFDASGDVATEYATWALRMRDLGRAVEGEELGAEARIEGAHEELPGRPTGYFVIEARDLAQAEAIARSHPHVGRGGTIEVRPIVER